jgi:DNA-binding NtrC family response regulator
MSSGGTLSRKIEQDSRGEPRALPNLFAILGATPARFTPFRCSLADIEQVAIGRSDKQALQQSGGQLRIGVPDPWMSLSHLLVRRVLDSWAVDDAGSKNGTFVNGRRAGPGPLEDGDVIEAGETFFLFRKHATPGEGERFVDGDDLRPPAAGLTTLVPALALEFAKIQAIAPSSVSVVIRGESGTGKEMVAQAVHRLSGRAGQFQAVNCAALPATLVESELFGYGKGAFTGAEGDRVGLVRAADRGTLFLDEIGDLPLGAQGALLRVLQESEVLPVGTTRPVKIDVRVVAATHRDLDALVLEHRFRGDLLARLRGLSVTLPQLSERREDLGLLVRALLQRRAPRRAAGIAFTLEAARALVSYTWPLNVRELDKCLESAAVLAGDGEIGLKHLPAELRTAARAASAQPEAAHDDLPDVQRQRRDEIVAALRDHGGNVTAAAKALGKARAQVQRWIRRYGIDRRGGGR